MNVPTRSPKSSGFWIEVEFISPLSAINHLEIPAVDFVPHWSGPSSKWWQTGLNQQHISWIKGRRQMWLMCIYGKKKKKKTMLKICDRAWLAVFGRQVPRWEGLFCIPNRFYRRKLRQPCSTAPVRSSLSVSLFENTLSFQTWAHICSVSHIHAYLAPLSGSSGALRVPGRRLGR